MGEKTEKEVVCLKCKKKFVSETDSHGIPYNKICPLCKKNIRNYGRGIKSYS